MHFVLLAGFYFTPPYSLLCYTLVTLHSLLCDTNVSPVYRCARIV
jgi:hypothetical protein